MKFLIEVFIEIKPLLWLLAAMIAGMVGRELDCLILLCITLLDFLTVYVLLWSREKKRI